MRDNRAAGNKPGPALYPIAGFVIITGNREVVTLSLLDHAARCIVTELDATRRILREHQVPVPIVCKAVDLKSLILLRMRYALLNDAPQPIVSVFDCLPQRISATKQFTRRAIPIASRLPPVVRLHNDPPQRIAFERV